MTHPDDATVKVLAEKAGWTFGQCDDHDCRCNRTHMEMWHCEGWFPKRFEELPLFLHSTDALRPVIAKLTEEEWVKLGEFLARSSRTEGVAPKLFWWTRYLLTLPPEQLARAVASAILACRKEQI